MTDQANRLSLQAGKLHGQRLALHEMSGYAMSFDSAELTSPRETAPNRVETKPALDHSIKEQMSQPGMVGQAPLGNEGQSEGIYCTSKVMKEARQQRAQALALLRALDSSSDVTSLDALDQRITATNSTFEEILRPSTMR